MNDLKWVQISGTALLPPDAYVTAARARLEPDETVGLVTMPQGRGGRGYRHGGEGRYRESGTVTANDRLGAERLTAAWPISAVSSACRFSETFWLGSSLLSYFSVST